MWDQTTDTNVNLTLRWKRIVGVAILGCFLLSVFFAYCLAPLVMPSLDTDSASLSERVASSSFGDAAGYGAYAEGILRYGTLSDLEGRPIIKHMPGLPLILAFTFHVFGTPWPFIVFQILLLFFSLYLFSIRIANKFNPVISLLVIFTFTFHPLVVKLFMGVMSDIIFLSLILLVAVCLWKTNLRAKDFFYCGILFGIAVYFRESAFPYMVAVGLAYLIEDRRKYLKPVAIMVATFMLLLAPWIIRNSLYLNSFIPLTTKGSDLFYTYSIPLTMADYNPFGDATYHYGRPRERRDRNKKAQGAGRSDTGVTSKLRAGIENYLSQPRKQIVSALLKTAALLNKPPLLVGREISGTAATGLFVINLLLYVFHLAVILLGIVLVFRTKFKPFIYLPYLVMALYLQALLFWSEPRYLLPLYPFLIVIALAWHWAHWGQRVSPALIGSSSNSERISRKVADTYGAER